MLLIGLGSNYKEAQLKLRAHFCKHCGHDATLQESVLGLRSAGSDQTETPSSRKGRRVTLNTGDAAEADRLFIIMFFCSVLFPIAF